MWVFSFNNLKINVYTQHKDIAMMCLKMRITHLFGVRVGKYPCKMELKENFQKYGL